MDLRRYNASKIQLDFLKNNLNYQPFIITDTCITGVADDWINRTGKLIMDKTRESESDWKRFSELNARLKTMYDDWIEAVWKTAESIGECTIVDIGCNTGYFLYGFLERGARRAIGYDIWDFGETINVLNEISGVRAEFFREKYDMMNHTMQNVEKGDVVISSAVMCHLSDPTYYLSFLGSITKKILMLFTAVDDTDDFRITFHGTPRVFYDNPFPCCFDGNTRVSMPLVELGLKELGFKSINVLPYKEEWIPFSFYKYYKLIIAER